MEKKIYEMEHDFLMAFNRALSTIEVRCDEGDPMTLKEVLEFGFNNVDFNGKFGYEECDFTEEELNKRVRLDECFQWDDDPDGYRYVILKEVCVEDYE